MNLNELKNIIEEQKEERFKKFSDYIAKKGYLDTPEGREQLLRRLYNYMVEDYFYKYNLCKKFSDPQYNIYDFFAEYTNIFETQGK